jgi:hypothetical protein
MMSKKQDEQRLLFVSIGVVFFSVLSIALFLVNLLLFFYISTLIAMALGFYLSRSLSASGDGQNKPATKGKGNNR